MTAGLPDALDFLRPARLIFRDERVASIDAQRQIEDGVVGKLFTAFGGQIALKDVVAFEPDSGVVRDNAQEETAAFLDGFAQFFFPVFAGLELLLVEPDKAPGLLKLADHVARDFQVGRGITHKDAAVGPVSFHDALCS